MRSSVSRPGCCRRPRRAGPSAARSAVVGRVPAPLPSPSRRRRPSAVAGDDVAGQDVAAGEELVAGAGVVPGVAEAADRQAELGDQPVAEGGGVHAGDPDRPVGAADVDPAAVGDLDERGGRRRRPGPGCRRPGTATVSTEFGEVTSGRAKSACALLGTSSSASTSGQTTGPPAEKA